MRRPALSLLPSLLLLLSSCGGASGVTPYAGPAVQPPPAGAVRILVGGDSRDDSSHVLPWAIGEAHARGAEAFLFLGDMMLTPQLDGSFAREIAALDPIPLYPVLGNHEIKQFGFLSIGQAAAERSFAARFLGTPRTPVRCSLPGRVVYSVNLPGGVHFVALDNVSQSGFGAEQLGWLTADLDWASADHDVRYVVVGMHKPLARNGVTHHGMDADGPQAIADSDAALDLFARHHVALLLASHVHQFTRLTQAGIPTYVTGGLGAPLTSSGPEHAFHHVLQLDVTDAGIHVEVVRYAGPPVMAARDEDDGD